MSGFVRARCGRRQRGTFEPDGRQRGTFDLQAKVELTRLAQLHGRLVAKAVADPRPPRSAPPKARPVLETVTRVLEQAGRPLRACEIHAAAERLACGPLLWSSVKGTLAAYSSGEAPRFRRVGRGVYQLTSWTRGSQARTP